MMSKPLYQEKQQKLAELMQNAGIHTLDELSDRSGVSAWQLARVQHGLLNKMPTEILLKLSQALGVSPNDILGQLLPEANLEPKISQKAQIYSSKPENESLEERLGKERQIIEQEFQQSSLEVIESWMLQWPTAVALAKKNPELSAAKLLTLVKPVMDLLKRWGVEPLCQVGEQIAYDPMYHELMEGEASVGDIVSVRYIGYTQGSKLLYRAKVSALQSPETPVVEEEAKTDFSTIIYG
jgi:DNA-binding Xre family transcriptional regulator